MVRIAGEGKDRKGADPASLPSSISTPFDNTVLLRSLPGERRATVVDGNSVGHERCGISDQESASFALSETDYA